MYVMFASAMQIRQPTLALKPRGDVTRNPKQGVPVAPKKDMCPAKTFKKKRKLGIISTFIIDLKGNKDIFKCLCNEMLLL